ncbi:MAG: T9SS type A sorting domain-containing protein, partial [Bacteroidia bacterium]
KTTMVIDAYPNPCSDRFSFRITEGVRPKSYSFFASDGRQMTFPKTVNEEFDVSAFPEGLYFLKIETGTGIITRKIIIQR